MSVQVFFTGNSAGVKEEDGALIMFSCFEDEFEKIIADYKKENKKLIRVEAEKDIVFSN